MIIFAENLNAMIYNPFITSGYVSPEYFCDRENETRQLVQNIQGHSHTVLISPRRMGKTGLIEHCFNQEVIKNDYHTFFLDIYSTMNLNDFVFLLGNRICRSLKTKDKQLMEMFVKVVKSIQFTIGFDEAGMMNGSFGLGDIKDSQKSLEEIFQYLEEAKRPCVVAIDEFQQIEKYPEKNVDGGPAAHLYPALQQCHFHLCGQSAAYHPKHVCFGIQAFLQQFEHDEPRPYRKGKICRVCRANVRHFWKSVCSRIY